MRESCRDFGKERPDVVHQVRGGSRLLDNPPYDECNQRICEDRLQFHCRLPGSADFSTLLIFLYLNRNPAWMGVQPERPWRRSSRLQYARNLVALRMRLTESMPPREKVCSRDRQTGSGHAGADGHAGQSPWVVPADPSSAHP